ncbi:hypothetical protein [Sunxiuqinia indica]|uniref:hypothetical protein n=1 Tax=Sunxiuqinia indica TaxID=2692584 RepID=UPI0013570DB2|nr:hypothetical protein [Sunxiuqinia indica]
MIENKIIEIANQFIGLTEKPGNSGFYDHEGIQALTHMHPEELFRTIGWKKGYAWCMLNCEVIWKLAYAKYDSMMIPELNRLFSASVAQTEANFKRSDLFVVDDAPKEGNIAVWRSFNAKRQMQWSGHAGIVIDYAHDHIKTIDGNTNSSGGREGIEVAEKRRVLDFTERPGLVLRCFIHPKEI